MSALTTTRGLLLVATLGAASASAQPWTVESCVAASEQGQRLQQQGKLLSAKQPLELCSHPSCPAVVQAACTKWLDEVLSATPTLIVVVRVDGVDQVQARVSLDGQPWLAELTGKPQALEPGEHRVKVEAGRLAQEQRLVVNVAEKNRLLVFGSLAPVAEVPAAPPKAVPVPAPAPATAPASAALPLLLSGVTVAGVAVFAGLGLSGRDRLDRLLASDCAATKTCNPATVGEIRQAFLGADLALAVGLVSAATAIWQWKVWAAEPTVKVTPYLAPGPQGGAALGVSGRW